MRRTVASGIEYSRVTRSALIRGKRRRKRRVWRDSRTSAPWGLPSHAPSARAAEPPSIWGWISVSAAAVTTSLSLRPGLPEVTSPEVPRGIIAALGDYRGLRQATETKAGFDHESRMVN